MIRDWGSTAEERARPYACDRHVPGGDALFRAVDVDAPPALRFRWLCQLRVAPYSYDWLDNLGRTSPRARDPRNEALAIGDRMMTIFRLVEIERERQLTARLVAKIVARVPRWSPMRWLLPAGDFVMMRKQLLTLKRLAEQEARSSET